MRVMVDHLCGAQRGAALRLGLQILVTLVVMGVCFALLANRLEGLHFGDVLTAMQAIPREACLLALLFVVLSHLALAGYDFLALTRIGRHVPWPRALLGGYCGTVIAQVLGFGAVTGSLARVRIYRGNGIRMPAAVALSGFVATGFFLGAGVLLALLILFDPVPVAQVAGIAPEQLRWAAALSLTGITAAAFVIGRHAGWLRFGALSLRFPDAKWLGLATLLAAFLPAEALPALPSFIAIYIAGVVLGHLANAPGAAGPLEGALLLALPAVPLQELAAAILLYRFFYYLLPFSLALLAIAGAARVPSKRLLSGDALKDRIDWVLDGSGQAEAELTYLGDKHVYFPADAQGFVCYGISGRIWLIMGDPVAPREAWDSLIDGLEHEARAVGARLATYKATEQASAFWQARGYHLQSLGEEAAIDLGEWSLEGSKKRELRRKLKGIAKAGVSLRLHAPGDLPLEDMRDVARAWHAAKGREQSFSMGHWEPAFNSRHLAVSAWCEDGLIGFVTIWQSGDGREWMLDLMRQIPDAPNGTMYALINEAITHAQSEGAESFNLCMAPLSGLEQAKPPALFSWLGARFYERFNARHGLKGIRRFKDVFRPNWSARYMAISGRLDLPEALLASWKLVNRQVNNAAQDSERCPRISPAAIIAAPEESTPAPATDQKVA